MQIVYDRGTLLLLDPPAGLDPEELDGVLWDPRVDAHRAPAWRHREIVEALGERELGYRDGASTWRRAPLRDLRPPELRPYQTAALWSWRAAGCRGVVSLPTGAGKTWVALGALADLRRPTLLVVPTRVLLHQWQRVLKQVTDGEVGCYGDGRRELAPITVATFESAYRHMARWGSRFGLLVVDEVHHFGDCARDLLLEMTVAPARLGLTATPPGPGAAAERLEELVGPLVHRASLAELRGRYLAEFQRITLLLELSPKERRTYDAEYGAFRRVFLPFKQQHPQASWSDFLRAAGKTEAGRRGVAAWRASRRLLAYTQAKSEALGWLLSQHVGRRVLIFTADNETAYRVAREHLVMPITCDIGRRERGRALELFREGRLRGLVSARVLNEGLDVPDADVGIIVGSSQGSREYVQRLGRLLRPAPGKHALLYELTTRSTSEGRHSRQRERLLTAPAVRGGG